MRLNVLGPIEVESGTRRRQLNSPTQRTLLALLLINRHRDVSVGRITKAIWREDDWRLGRKRMWFHISKSVAPAERLRTLVSPLMGRHDVPYVRDALLDA